MARPVHAAALALLLAACLLFQAADCSRPSPRGMPLKHAAAAVPHRHGAPTPPHKHYDAGTGTDGVAAGAAVATTEDEGRRTLPDNGSGAAAATPSSASAISAVGRKDHGDGFVSGGSNWRSAAAALLMRSKLARRFLAGEGVVQGADSAAGPSCRSHDVHNNCPPGV